MMKFLFDRMNEKIKDNKTRKIAGTLAAVTHTHTHIVF